MRREYVRFMFVSYSSVLSARHILGTQIVAKQRHFPVEIINCCDDYMRLYRMKKPSTVPVRKVFNNVS